MDIVLGVLLDFVHFFSFKTKKGRVMSAIALAIIIVAGYFIFGQNGNDAEEEVSLPPVVTVSTAGQLVNNDGYSLIGSVEAKDQARIQTEAGGRVTSVPVELSQNVTAGQIIAQLENGSQYASLLQAQGVYEAAQAAAAQSEVSVADANNALTAANNNARNTYRNAYTTANNAMLTTVDQFYSGSQNSFFGVRIESKGQAVNLTAARRVVATDLNNWQQKLAILNNATDIALLLNEAEIVVNKVISQVDSFIELTSTADQSDQLDGQSVRSYTAELIALRASLNGTINSIDNARSSIASAEETIRRAEIGSTQAADVSAANAQIKQALGSLRAAEAAYNKTIIRTPIAGTLNELSLKAGDYVGIGSPVALVANNNALEITTYVGEIDARRVSVGQSVMIENTIPGVITAVAPGVDLSTKKTEVKIGTESTELKTGDTVIITFANTENKLDTTAPVRVPLTAVKFNATDGSVLVVEDGILVRKPVTLGPIVGSFVVIEDGVDYTTEFVVDARGLTEGTKVEAIRD